MKNAEARLILKEVRDRLARRKRPLKHFLMINLEKIDAAVLKGWDITHEDGRFLLGLYERLTDPTPLKWGNAVRIPRDTQ